MTQILIQAAIIFSGILFLTFLQSLHFKMLYFMANKSHSFFGNIIRFIIRFGIIIHEFSHMLFGFISGAKIQKVELFRKDGGRVTFATKNYIGALPQYGSSPGFVFLLFFNQIGVFLTSLGPLLLGLLLSYIFVVYFELPLRIEDVYNYNMTTTFVIMTTVFIIIIPSFILSYQDMRHFFLSKQDSIGASIVASIINTFVFICFLGFLTFFFEFFVIFGVLYLVLFLILSLIFSVFYIFHKSK